MVFIQHSYISLWYLAIYVFLASRKLCLYICQRHLLSIIRIHICKSPPSTRVVQQVRGTEAEGWQRGCVIQYSTGAGGAASVVNHFPRGPVPWVASGDIIREIPSWVSLWRGIYSSSGGADTQFDLNNQTFSNQIHNKQTFRNEYPDTHQSYHDTVLRTVAPEERAE